MNLPQTQHETIVSETDKHFIVALPNGKFRKDMKYKEFMSFIPETKEQMIELYKIFNEENNPNVTPMSDIKGQEFYVQQVYIRPYQSFDEETGNVTNGVTTTFFDGEKYIATSSKSVYHTINKLMNVFGQPNTEGYTPFKVVVTGVKRENGVQINIELVGF